MPAAAIYRTADSAKPTKLPAQVQSNSSQDRLKKKFIQVRDGANSGSLREKHSSTQIQPKQGGQLSTRNNQRAPGTQDEQQSHQFFPEATNSRVDSEIQKPKAGKNNVLRSSVEPPRSDAQSIFSKVDDGIKSNRRDVNLKSISTYKSRDLFPFLDENIAQVHLNKITGNITNGGLGISQEQNDISNIISMSIMNPMTRGDTSLYYDGVNEGEPQGSARNQSEEESAVLGASKVSQHSMLFNNGRRAQALVESSFRPQNDFRNPYLKVKSTFSRDPKRINRRVFDKAYAGEFRGKDSPSPTEYQRDTIQRRTKYESKTLPRDERVCPLVPKQQLQLKNVSP